jgi:GABA(A) receptor-associated protein
MKSFFQSSKTLQERINESTKIKEKYTERIPIICEKSNNRGNNLPQIEKFKYLVPKEFTIAQFMFVIRKRLDINDSQQAIFLFINGTIPATNSIISEIYETHKNEDGFLYINYSGENTFG